MSRRRVEDAVEMLARLDRDVADLRRITLARHASRRRLRVPVFQGVQGNSQSIPGTLVAVTLDTTAVIDTHGGHETMREPSHWTVPTGWSGIYELSGRVRIATVVSGAEIDCAVAHNGAVLDYSLVRNYGGGGDISASTGAVYAALTEGDFVQLAAAQHTGTSRSTIAAQCALSACFVRRP